ncbi:hypothetical protein H4R20_002948, partial [Coemansia guatemalensis]
MVLEHAIRLVDSSKQQENKSNPGITMYMSSTQMVDPLQFIFSKPTTGAASGAQRLAAAISQQQQQQQVQNQPYADNNRSIRESARTKNNLDEKPFAKILSVEKQTRGRVVEVEITREALHRMLQL